MFTNEELLVIRNITRISLIGMHAERGRVGYLDKETLSSFDNDIEFVEHLLIKLDRLVG